MRVLYIPKIKVEWGDNTEVKKKTKDWGCVGETALFLIFHWIKQTSHVRKLIEVVVDDFEEPHSDEAIINCLTGLKVEVWDWRRMDISSDVIMSVAGKHVRVVHLYCSGLNAVLRSWSAATGLPTLELVSYLSAWTCFRNHLRLSQLEKVYVEIHQVASLLNILTMYPVADFP